MSAPECRRPARAAWKTGGLGWGAVLGLFCACIGPIPEPGLLGDDTQAESVKFQALLEHYCLFSPDHTRGWANHAESCLYDMDFDVLRARRAVEAGRLAIDPDVLARCLDSEDVPGFDWEVAWAGQCAGVWVPLGKANDACDSHLMCPVGYYCARSVWGRSRPHYVAGACGTCRPRSALGEACVGTGWVDADMQCAAGLLCDIDLERCVEPRPSCESNGDCATGFQCVLGSCRARGTLATGEACSRAGDCVDGSCVLGACLDASCTSVCAPSVPDGGSCSYSSDCGETSYCNAGRVCVAVAEGTPCSADYYCGSELVCAFANDEPVCAERVGENEPCLSTEQCPTSFTCLAGHCLGRVQPGEECLGKEQCSPAFDCLAGRCRGYATVGSSCDGSDAYGRTECELGSDCRDGVCQRWAEYGEPCDGGCVKGACLEGVCRTPALGSNPHQVGLHTCGDLTFGPESVCIDAIPDGSSCAGREGNTLCEFGSFCSDALSCAAICVL